MKKLKTGKAADESSLSHTKWNCMYHIVFIPKYRRKLFQFTAFTIRKNFFLAKN